MADGPLLAPATDIAAQAAAMAGANVGSLRLAVYWSDAQPSPTAPLDLAATDAVVLAAARNAIGVLPVVLRAPSWARRDAGDPGSPPRRNSDYANFLTALVARYGPSGTLWAEHPDVPRTPIRRWQVWNEPDIRKYWTPARSQTAWARPYVALLRAAHTALKRADRGSTVVAAGLTNRSWIDLRRLYAAGARGHFDVAALHPFSRRVSNVVKIVRLARAEMRRAHDARRRVLLTEISWSSGKGSSTFNYGWETTEQGQAERVRQILPALAKVRRAYRIDGVYWYTWLSPAPGSRDSFDYGGLRRLDGAGGVVDKPALFAFRDTVALLRR